MRSAPAPERANRPWAAWASSLPVGAALIGFGGWFMHVGTASSPLDDARARGFRSETSCSVAAARAGTHGECTSEPMSVGSVEMRWHGSLRNRRRAPYISMLLGDGTIDEEKLDGRDGVHFVESVRAGAAGHVQYYHGIVVRVVSGALSAETPFAPDAEASSDEQMIWFGAGGIALGAIIALLAIRKIIVQRAA